jgi:hypothetical protein
LFSSWLSIGLGPAGNILSTEQQTRASPHKETDPNRQQNLSPTGLGIGLFSLQADPLKKILHRYSHDQGQQDGVEGMQEKLEACGLEELQS